MNKDREKKLHLFLLAAVMSMLIWSVIKPFNYGTWALEVIPAVLGLGIVIALYRRFPFTALAYIIMAILSILMFIGGHYTYSLVPVFTWLKEHFHLERNYYDRVGHFLKGFFVIVVREVLLRKTPLQKGGWLAAISVSISLAIAAVYEIIEWVVAKAAPGKKTTKEFLGTQGDIWDTQWDMLLNLLGAVLALVLLAKLHNKMLARFSLKKFKSGEDR